MPHSSVFNVKEGAIIVADAHYASYRPYFKDFLIKLRAKEIVAPQLILLGDNVDILVGKIKFFMKQEKDLIDLINLLATRIEIIYFEGNHDFLLKELFPLVKVVPLTEQPLCATFKESSGWLAHGDWKEGLVYKVFSTVLRSRFSRMLYRLADLISLSKASRSLRKKLKDKVICQKFSDFEQRMQDKFSGFRGKGSWFIEGHYHQGVELDIEGLRYINLEAMACNKSYFVVQSRDNEIVLTKRIL